MDEQNESPNPNDPTPLNDSDSLTSDNSLTGENVLDEGKVQIVQAIEGHIRVDTIIGTVKGDISIDTSISEFVTKIGTLAGLAVVISGIYITIVERPNILFPIILATFATIGGCVLLFYVPFAKKEVTGFYRRASVMEDEPPPITVFVYERKWRMISLVLGTVLIICAVGLVLVANWKSAG